MAPRRSSICRLNNPFERKLPARHDDRHLFRIPLQLRVTEPTGKPMNASTPRGNELAHAAVLILFVPLPLMNKRCIAALAQACLDATQSSP